MCMAKWLLWSHFLLSPGCEAKLWSKAFTPTVLARGWTSLWNFGTKLPVLPALPSPMAAPWQVVQVLKHWAGSAARPNSVCWHQYRPLWVGRVVPNHRGMLSCWVAGGSVGTLAFCWAAQRRFFNLALVTAGVVVVRRTFHGGLGDAGRVCRYKEVFLDFRLLLDLGKGCWWWESWAEERSRPAVIALVDTAWNTVSSPLLGWGKGFQLPVPVMAAARALSVSSYCCAPLECLGNSCLKTHPVSRASVRMGGTN